MSYVHWSKESLLGGRIQGSQEAEQDTHSSSREQPWLFLFIRIYYGQQWWVMCIVYPPFKGGVFTVLLVLFSNIDIG